MSNINNITDITIEDYSDKAIVVRGNTIPYKEKIAKLGGKWNAKLRDGPGWIFPKTKRSSIEQWISTGEVVDTPRRVYSQNVVEEKQEPFDKILRKITDILPTLSLNDLIELRKGINNRINQFSADDAADMVEELEDSEEVQ